MRYNIFVLWVAFAAIRATNGLSLSTRPTFLIIGGTGKVGSSVASHVLYRQPKATIILAGRSAEKGRDAIRELQELYPRSRSSISIW
jgi:glutamyl-tRNA reductase